MNKKILTLSILSLFLFSMFLGFVDAAEKSYDKSLGSDCERGLIVPWLMGTDCGSGLVCNTENICVERGSLNMEEKIPGFLEGVLDSEKSNLVYDRLIMFVLILSVIFGVLSTVNIFGTEIDKKKGMFINLIISAALGLLGIRFLPENWISSLATPATAMVALITAGLPFLIVHIITGKWLKEGHGINRVKTIWGIYFLLMIGLFINNLKISEKGVGLLSPKSIIIVFLVITVLEFVFVEWRLKRIAKNIPKDVEAQVKIALANAKKRSKTRRANAEIDEEQLRSNL